MLTSVDYLFSLPVLKGFVALALYVLLFWQRRAIHFGIIVHVLVVMMLLAGANTTTNLYSYFELNSHERSHSQFNDNADFVFGVINPLLLLWIYQ